jgi:SAM-dependent methyltransferase
MSSRSTPAWGGEEVKANFNGFASVLHYARAAHNLGLWESERLLFERFLPAPPARLLEAGCGAGRVTLGLWQAGYRSITAFDFAAELLDQARSLAMEQGASRIRFLEADATALDPSAFGSRGRSGFDAALFMFNGLMQIPGRENRRATLRGIASLCRPGAPLVFTSHDRGVATERTSFWREEEERWRGGMQDPRLGEFGDRIGEDESGPVFIHIPDRAEILGDLAACGWEPVFDAMRGEIAAESAGVREFADDCRFWVARRRKSPPRP